jgi:hypothetical protein
MNMKVPAILAAAAGAILPAGAAALAADCENTSTGLVPLSDLGAGLYLGQYPGGLYPAGLNGPPPAHAAEGLARAGAIQPLDGAGNPDPGGRYVMLSIGMSNTTQEFCSQPGSEPCSPWTFMGQAAADPEVNGSTLRLVNGALGGQSASTWDSPLDQNYNRVRDTVLAPLGLTEAQVAIAWVKVANPGPTHSLPSPQADAVVLLSQMGNIARALRVRYPNIRLAFFSSRIYAGYASTPLNPEPYAYESAFAVKWLVQAQIQQMSGGAPDPVAGNLNLNTVVPWIGWGPYLWADGLTPRSDGLTWACADLDNDGTHPSVPGEEKVGTMLLDFFKGSPYTRPWFLSDPPPPGDLDGDGVVGIVDFLELLSAWGPCPAPCPPQCPGDLDGTCSVGVVDLLLLLSGWGT